MQPVDEATYAETLNEIIVPLLRGVKRDDWLTVEREGIVLEGVFHKPSEQGIHSIFFDHATFRRHLAAAGLSDDQAEQSRANHLKNPRPGTILISHGFTEFAIKYAELIWYFLLEGYSVFIVEHRGHGKSLRENPLPSVVSIDDWRHYISDFAGALAHARREFGIPRPYKLFAHSLGGAIGVGLLEKYPTLFSRAVLSSPMLEPKTGMPTRVAQRLSSQATVHGHGVMKIPAMSVFSAETKGHRTGGRSQARVQWFHTKRVEDLEYQTTAPSFNWVFQALAMDHAIGNPKSIARIVTPTLLLQAGRDHWVQPAAQRRFVALAQEAGVPVHFTGVPRASHEIFAESNVIVGPYLQRVLDFLNAA